MNKVGKWLWGLVLVVVGVVLGLNAMGVIQADVFFPGWWTLFIIVPCAIDLLSSGENDRGDHVGSVIGIVVGGIILFGCLGVVNFEILWKLVLPILLVLVGAALIWGGLTGQKVIEVMFKQEAKEQHEKRKRRRETVQEAEVVKDTTKDKAATQDTAKDGEAAEKTKKAKHDGKDQAETEEGD